MQLSYFFSVIYWVDKLDLNSCEAIEGGQSFTLTIVNLKYIVNFNLMSNKSWGLSLHPRSCCDIADFSLIKIPPKNNNIHQKYLYVIFIENCSGYRSVYFVFLSNRKELLLPNISTETNTDFWLQQKNPIKIKWNDFLVSLSRSETM